MVSAVQRVQKTKKLLELAYCNSQNQQKVDCRGSSRAGSHDCAIGPWVELFIMTRCRGK